MFRKSGKCRAGRLDFATIFIKPSILHKINTNIGKIDHKFVVIHAIQKKMEFMKPSLAVKWWSLNAVVWTALKNGIQFAFII